MANAALLYVEFWADRVSARDVVRAYHARTKHRPDGFAQGPQTLDWEAQPGVGPALQRDPSEYQTLYHFTVGRALADPRIESSPAYPARSRP